MKRLYTVTVTFDFVVAADSEFKAHLVAERQLKNAVDDISPQYVDVEIGYGVRAEGWDDECIPYGGDGITRIKDYQ